MNPRRPLSLLFFVFFIISSIRFAYSISNSQNLETFYPFPVLVPSPAPSPSNSGNSPPPNSSLLFPSPPQFSPSSPPLLEQSSSSDNSTLVKAVAATAATTFVIATLLFFFVRRHVIARRKRNNSDDKSSGGLQPGAAGNGQFARGDGNFKGMIIDENGLDVLYWRKLEGKNRSNRSVVTRGLEEDDEADDVDLTVQAGHRRRKSEPIQEIPLLRGKSSASQNKVVPEISNPDRIMAEPVNEAIGKPNLSSQTSNPPPAPPLPPPPSLMGVPAKQQPAPVRPPPPPIPLKNNNSTPPPPPPVPPKKTNSTPPPTPPPVPVKKSNITSPPPPPPIPVKKSNITPPPPKAAGAAKGSEAGTSGTGGSLSAEDKIGSGNGQVKLKPLHWDKVNKNTDHSMVWDKIGGGSFRFDDDLMEALFGYVATNRRSPKKERETSDSKSQSSSSPAQIAILDSRKSQNIAIVLKSLGISRSELFDALTNGHGLNAETLERVMRIAPTKEEESQILEFDGDTSRLADAESFLYHLLKAVPSAFARLDAMLFRLNYDSEILQYEDSLQTLELGCKELRNRGLFVKLLEAILKAGNRMNAGTSRGNAQAFNLTSLQKLSDVKSTDGKTTLLHFIVEEVVRAEGKRCVMNRNRSLNRSSSRSSSSSNSIASWDNSASKDEREKEYIMLGLPMVGGLSAEFSNVKKAAQIDYNSFAGTYSALTARVAEVRLIASQCAANGEGNFANEMKSFVEAAEYELKVLREEENRIMELVRKTTEYYQAGASKKKGAPPLQLFAIIKDFLGMVDRVCIEITRNMQRRKTPSPNFGSSPKSPASRVPVKFPNLPEHFMKEKSSSSSSESETDV
ncbi:formin-like protein 4 [Ricinus communis]|uniref:formin-like protein 4 n=1 Tax=Ricinus communis TaxID=3988 RepID=UPI00201B2191|nr:formin-like protein 4 [Ricinus communis]